MSNKNELKYKVLALDLDGTLTNSEKIITPRTFQALMKLQERGVKLVLASGRPTYGIAPLAEQLKIGEYGGYVLPYNGGQIISWKDKKVLSAQLLPNPLLPIIYKVAHDDGHAIMSYRGDEIITESPTDKYVQEEATINKMPLIGVENFLEALPTEVPKCLIAGTPELLPATINKLKELSNGEIEAYTSLPFFIEVVPKGIDKAASLAALLKELCLEAENLVAIGDGYNDLSMIRFSGMGVAMANAQDGVKTEADYVTTADNDHDGVAEMIERVFFGK